MAERHSIAFLVVAGASLLQGCASSPTGAPRAAAAPAAATASAASPAADDLLQAVLWTQRAAEHDLVVAEVYHAAGQKLLAALDDPAWDALPREDREGSLAGLPPAVILDVDETVLDNSPFEARLVRSGEEYGEFSWSQWCREEAARALPGAVEFARLAEAKGVTLFYVSNRAKDLQAATIANLRKAGLPVAGEESFLGLGTILAGCEQVGSDKGCRRRLVAQRYRVLMQLGDQLDDFVDVVANTPDGRGASVEPYRDWIGERWFVFPNPLYGSWLPAQFHNDWSQPRTARRRALIDALRVE